MPHFETPVEASKKLLKKAEDQNFSTVVIAGFTPEGDFRFSSSLPDAPDVLWILECAKKRLMEASFIEK
jgi:hypothetical protein